LVQPVNLWEGLDCPKENTEFEIINWKQQRHCILWVERNCVGFTMKQTQGVQCSDFIAANCTANCM